MTDTRSASLKILYWTLPMTENKVIELDGLEDFKSELAQEYISVVYSRPGDRGGGLYELAVEFIASIRVKLHVDETMTDFTNRDYLGFWGLWYDFGGFRVYDVQNKILMREEFFTSERYWFAREERWRRQREGPRSDKD